MGLETTSYERRYVATAARCSRRRKTVESACLALLLVLLPITSAADGCPGDCNQSGLVDVADVATLAGSVGADARACLSADVDHDGIISLAEELAAVDNLLGACSVSAAERAARVTALLYPLTRLPLLELLFSLAVGGAGNSGTCELGGMYASRCDDLVDERIAVRIGVDQCGGKTIEGLSRVDGTVTLLGNGLCPYLIVPGSMALDFALDVRVGETDAPPILTVRADTSARLDGFVFDRPPCRVRGGLGTLTGTVVYDGAAGPTRIEASGLRLRFELSQFQLDPICDPATIVATLDGNFIVNDQALSAPLPLLLHGLRVTRHRLNNLIDVDGIISSDALGGELELHSVEPLATALTHRLPSAGVLELRSSGQTEQLSFK